MRTTAAPEAPVTSTPAPIDAEQTAIREEEARKQAQLIARQAADVAAKQERQKKRKVAQEPVAEAPPASEATQAQAPAVPSSADTAPAAAAVTAEAKPAATGTLHKPASRPGDTGDKKTAKKQVKQVVWRDESAKKRTIKTRGGEVGGAGWHARKDRHARVKTETETGCRVRAWVLASDRTDRARGP